MIFKIIIKSFLIFFLLFNLVAKANDIASMSDISEAAGSSAQAAANQLASDTAKVTENISGATAALGEAQSDIGKALDVSIAQAENAMAFATESLAKGDITSAVQAMSLVEGVTDMALGAIPDPTSLDMTGIDFAKDFSPEEMAALSTLRSQIPGKVVSIDVEDGAEVKKGDTVCTLESMKMQVAVKAQKDGIVKGIKIKEGNSVNKNDVIADIE